MFFDSLYQVILACGSQSDVVQFRSIFRPAVTVTDVDVNATVTDVDVNTTDVTGTV